jgi:hypothetical protein
MLIAGCSDEKNDQGLPSSPTEPDPPAVKLGAITPVHLQSNLGPDATVTVNVFASVDNSLALVENAVRLIRVKDMAEVKGSWKNNQGNYPVYSALFTPSAPLANGEYVVKITPKSNVVEPMLHTQSIFHVGSLPRVRYVEWETNQSASATVATRLLFRFSEPVATAVLPATVETKVQAGAFKAVTFTNPSKSVEAAVLDLKTPISLDDTLRINIKSDVGAPTGVKLDGLYTAKAGSGDFTATFVPRSHMAKHNRWLPPLTY